MNVFLDWVLLIGLWQVGLFDSPGRTFGPSVADLLLLDRGNAGSFLGSWFSRVVEVQDRLVR